MTTLFRQHHELPARRGSRLYAALAQEWIELNQSAGIPTLMRRWARTEPALTGMRSPAHIVDTIDAGDYDTKDRLLAALIRLHHAGQQLAGRIVLQCMLPAISNTARQLGRRRNPTQSVRFDAWEEHRHHAVSAFWDVLADYPISRREHRVAANLSKETWRRLSNEARIEDTDPTTPGMTSDGWLGAQNHPFTRVTMSTPGTNLPVDPVANTIRVDTVEAHIECLTELHDMDADDLIRWAHEHGVITTPDAEALTHVYTTSGGGYDAIITTHQISYTAARQRVARARARMITAIRAELASTAA